MFVKKLAQILKNPNVITSIICGVLGSLIYIINYQIIHKALNWKPYFTDLGVMACSIPDYVQYGNILYLISVVFLGVAIILPLLTFVIWTMTTHKDDMTVSQ